MPKPKSLRSLDFEMREALIQIFYDVTPMPSTGLIQIAPASPVGQVRHNYQAEQFRYQGHYYIYYNSKKLGELWQKPHKLIKIYERYDKDRLYMKVLERVARTYIPEAKVELVYGE